MGTSPLNDALGLAKPRPPYEKTVEKEIEDGGARFSPALDRYRLDERLPEVHTLRRLHKGRIGGHAGGYSAATVGQSEAMRRLRSQVERIAPYYRAALLTGPAGTGKEGIARLLHALSPCANGEFVACDASALAEAMLRDEGRTILDAVAGGVVGGTLFLDDLGEVPPTLQGALLRIWTTTGRGRLRVVGGTHRDLRTMGMTGQFRPDLAQRVMGVELAVIPLSRRMEDFPAVLVEVLRRIDMDHGLTLDEDAMTRLLDYGWPGDLAEVDQVLWTAVRVAEGSKRIELKHLPEMREQDPEEDVSPKPDKLQDVVQRHVLEVLTRCAGNKMRAAEVLGISRSTLYRMLENCVGEGFGEDI
jgi:DNA-binding NtrC family response regulator